MNKDTSLSELRQRAREECGRRGVLYAEWELLEGGEFIPILRRLRRRSALKLGVMTLWMLLEILLALLMYTGSGGNGGGTYSPALISTARLLMVVLATVMSVQALREAMRCDALIRALENGIMSHQ